MASPEPQAARAIVADAALETLIISDPSKLQKLGIVDSVQENYSRLARKINYLNTDKTSVVFLNQPLQPMGKPLGPGDGFAISSEHLDQHMTSLAPYLGSSEYIRGDSRRLNIERDANPTSRNILMEPSDKKPTEELVIDQADIKTFLSEGPKIDEMTRLHITVGQSEVMGDLGKSLATCENEAAAAQGLGEVDFDTLSGKREAAKRADESIHRALLGEALLQALQAVPWQRLEEEGIPQAIETKVSPSQGA